MDSPTDTNEASGVNTLVVLDPPPSRLAQLAAQLTDAGEQAHLHSIDAMLDQLRETTQTLATQINNHAAVQAEFVAHTAQAVEEQQQLDHVLEQSIAQLNDVGAQQPHTNGPEASTLTLPPAEAYAALSAARGQRPASERELEVRHLREQIAALEDEKLTWMVDQQRLTVQSLVDQVEVHNAKEVADRLMTQYQTQRAEIAGLKTRVAGLELMLQMRNQDVEALRGECKKADGVFGRFEKEVVPALEKMGVGERVRGMPAYSAMRDMVGEGPTRYAHRAMWRLEGGRFAWEAPSVAAGESQPLTGLVPGDEGSLLAQSRNDSGDEETA